MPRLHPGRGRTGAESGEAGPTAARATKCPQAEPSLHSISTCHAKTFIGTDCNPSRTLFSPLPIRARPKTFGRRPGILRNKSRSTSVQRDLWVEPVFKLL